MSTIDDLPLLRATLALAAADGKITRSEWGVIRAMADRAGVGRVSLAAMVDQAQRQPDDRDELLSGPLRDPVKAVRLLVATARIDGEISVEERSVIVDVACKLGIKDDAFAEVYAAGIELADTLRKRKYS